MGENEIMEVSSNASTSSDRFWVLPCQQNGDVLTVTLGPMWYCTWTGGGVDEQPHVVYKNANRGQGVKGYVWMQGGSGYSRDCSQWYPRQQLCLFHISQHSEQLGVPNEYQQANTVFCPP